MSNVGLASKVPRHRSNQILRLPDPLLTFRVYPEGRSDWYVEVQVYRTWKQLSRMHELYYPRKKDHSVWGFLAKAPSGQRLGILCLYLRSCTDNNVTHEFHHASMLWAEALRLAPATVCGWDRAAHERVAEAHGWMVSQFWRRFAVKYRRRECWGFERVL